MSKNDFPAQLTRQLNFLGRSCALYDELGYEDEAIRIAVVLRTLFHQTRASTSLVNHLGNPELEMPSYVPLDFDSEEVIFFQGLSLAEIVHTKSARLLPLLGKGPPTLIYLSFEQWWNQVVWVSGELKLTRRSIVLGAANKDGGAHVDENLPEDYSRFIAEDGFMEMPVGTFGTNEVYRYNFKNTHYSSLRQIAWEAMKCDKLMELSSSNV